MNNKELIKEGFEIFFNTPNFDETYLRTKFDVSYRQSVDGTEMTLEEFIEHAKLLKSRTHSINIQFKSIISEGEIVFSNHIIHAIMNDGSETTIQVIAEFRIKNGKMYYCDELTRLIQGNQESRDLGSAY
jgi:predicted SnoaL-like aldol condensation-catalyzing enzyme